MNKPMRFSPYAEAQFPVYKEKKFPNARRISKGVLLGLALEESYVLSAEPEQWEALRNSIKQNGTRTSSPTTISIATETNTRLDAYIQKMKTLFPDATPAEAIDLLLAAALKVEPLTHIQDLSSQPQECSLDDSTIGTTTTLTSAIMRLALGNYSPEHKKSVLSKALLVIQGGIDECTTQEK